MKIIVDCIPENPNDCLFSEIESTQILPIRHICKLSKIEKGLCTYYQLCAYYQSGWKKECPFLKIPDNK